MVRRGGRPGLLGTMARTAVIAGTASAVSGGVQSRQQARYQESNRQQQAPAAPAPQSDTIAELQKLGQLKQSGLLTDEEFAAAKAKLLGL